NTQTQCAGLTGVATPGDTSDHVVCTAEVQHGKGVGDQLLVQLVREVVLECTAVDRDGAGTRNQAHAGNCLLAAAYCGAGNVENGTGSCGNLGRLRRLGGEAFGSLFDDVVFRHGDSPYSDAPRWATW